LWQIASPITLAPDGLVRRRPARILIVDDEPLVVTALCRGLPTDRIEGVHSVREAEALWERTFPFDVVLCDVMMPNSNGADLYEKLRRKHPGAERRIIFMTGQAFSPNAREMLTTVPNRCLNKPIDAQELALAVRAVMQEAADASPPGRAH
jgi:DNA-binding NarL/FixJ family response regulator